LNGDEGHVTNVLLFVLLLLPAQTLPPPEEWIAAERAIVRLKPEAFKNLPAAVRVDLDKRQCTIPQPDGLDPPGPHNVIKGRFTSPASTDIAVLCSVGGVSTILIYRGGTTQDVAALAAMADKGFLQTGYPKRIEFSRAILPAAPSDIRASHKEFGVGQLPRIDHDGIHNAFVGKASTIMYWDGKKWLELAGMD
jgi:hypothetical protein